MNRKGLKRAAKQCIAEAKGPVKKVSLLYILSIVVILALDLAISEFSGSGSSSRHISDGISSTVSTYVTVYGFSLALQALMILLEAGFTCFALKLSRNEEFSAGVLLDGFRDWFRVICFYLLQTLYMALWTFVLVIPVALVVSPLALGVMEGTVDQIVLYLVAGILSVLISLFLSLRYWGGFFVLMDHPEMTAGQALTHTKDLCKHHRLQLFGLELSFLPLILLSVLTLGILLIWKLPYIMATYAHTYHQLTIRYYQRTSYQTEQ